MPKFLIVMWCICSVNSIAGHSLGALMYLKTWYIRIAHLSSFIQPLQKVLFMFWLLYRGQFVIPTGLYSDRSIFRQVDIPTGLYSDRFIFRKVVIPTGLYSDRSIFRQVVILTGQHSERSIFRQVVIPTGRYSDRSLFSQFLDVNCDGN